LHGFGSRLEVQPFLLHVARAQSLQLIESSREIRYLQAELCERVGRACYQRKTAHLGIVRPECISIVGRIISV
jgi:hypothetical protein